MHILNLTSSPRGDNSFSLKLGNAIVEKLLAVQPGSDVSIHNLAQHPLPHLNEAHLNSFFTPVEQRTPEMVAAVRHSDDAIAELQAADTLVIGVPIYNFNLPSTLKSWFDHIARAGITFRYSAQGPEGLVQGKKVYIAISSGGVYSEGAMQAYDFIEPYLRFMLGFLGMTDVTVFRVEGVANPEQQQAALDQAIAAITL